MKRGKLATVLGLAAASAVAPLTACVQERPGTVGTVEVCSTTLPEYEGTVREVVSSLTGVDTGADVQPVASGAGCCLGDDGWPADWYTAARTFIPPTSLQIPALSTDAAKYPWGGFCPPAGGPCETCNVCRYGIQEAQGTWVDIPAISGLELYGDVANRLAIDGNTFLWQFKHRTSGLKVQYRGYYFCSTGPAVTFVLTEVERTPSPPCPDRYPNDSGAVSPSEPWPDARSGSGVVGDVAGERNWLGGVWVTLRIVEDEPTAGALRDYAQERNFCHPGEPFASDADGQTTYRCPDESEFLDCWEATEAP